MRLTPRIARGKQKKAGRRTAPRTRRLAWGGLAVAGLAGIGAGAWQIAGSGWLDARAAALGDATVDRTARAGLVVREVVVSGRERTARDHLLAALDVERGTPILAVDIEEARLRIESLGWVKRAEVVRRLPDVIFLRIEERAPLALWQHEGKLALIDDEGAVILRDGLGRYAELPMVVGEDAPAHAFELIGLLRAFPEVAGELEAAVRVSERRWNLRLRNGIDVRLPESDLAPALARLDDLQREHDLLDRDVIAVDLRVPGRLIVRVNPAAVPRVRRAGKDT